MAEEYNIPADVDELFATGPAEWHIFDDDTDWDNVEALANFIEIVGIPDELILDDQGTRLWLRRGDARLVIDSGGLGDFTRHGFSVSIPDEKDEP